MLVVDYLCLAHRAELVQISWNFPPLSIVCRHCIYACLSFTKVDHLFIMSMTCCIDIQCYTFIIIGILY